MDNTFNNFMHDSLIEYGHAIQTALSNHTAGLTADQIKAQFSTIVMPRFDPRAFYARHGLVFMVTGLTQHTADSLQYIIKEVDPPVPVDKYIQENPYIPDPFVVTPREAMQKATC